MKHSEINWPLFVRFLKDQIGKPYVFGVENDPDEKLWSNYKAWDCSEIIQVAFHKIGIEVPDGSYNQAKVCKNIDGKALLIGDLGFKAIPETGAIHHVGAYVGDGNIIEAKGKAWGVVTTTVDAYMSSTHFSHWGRLKSIEDA